MKNQKGITLVALVVTIIVLLILAGVSLSLVAGGDGILGRATNAVDVTNEASAKEQAELLIAELVTEYYEARYAPTSGTPTAAKTPLEYIQGVFGTSRATADYTVTLSGADITVAGGEVNITGEIKTSGKVVWDGSNASV